MVPVLNSIDTIRKKYSNFKNILWRKRKSDILNFFLKTLDTQKVTSMFQKDYFNANMAHKWSQSSGTWIRQKWCCITFQATSKSCNFRLEMFLETFFPGEASSYIVSVTTPRCSQGKETQDSYVKGMWKENSDEIFQRLQLAQPLDMKMKWPRRTFQPSHQMEKNWGPGQDILEICGHLTKLAEVASILFFFFFMVNIWEYQ